MKSEWNESCTESISYTQVNSSIIKDQIGVLSVLVSRNALEGHLVAEHGNAWPCSEAFSGCYCHHNGDRIVWLTLLYTVVFFYFILYIYLSLICFSPEIILRTLHSGNTQKSPFTHELGSFKFDIYCVFDSWSFHVPLWILVNV